MNTQLGVYDVKYMVKKIRGVNMPATAANLKDKGKKQPNVAATAPLKKDKAVMDKITQGRKEAKAGKTHSWDSVFGD